MKALVNGLSGLVRRVPWVIIIIVAVVSVPLFGLAGQFQPGEDQNEAFAPEAPEIEASAKIGALFGTTESRMQVLVSADVGDVITMDGMATAAAVNDAVRSGESADLLIDRADAPAIVSYLAPVTFAVAEGNAAAPTSDSELKQVFAASYEQTPDDRRTLVDLLLPSSADPTTARSEFGLIVITYESSEGFDAAAANAQVMADAVATADLPPGVAADPFNTELVFSGTDDEFQQEIFRLLLAAVYIILIVLAAVFLITDIRHRWLTILGFVILILAITLAITPSLVPLLNSGQTLSSGASWGVVGGAMLIAAGVFTFWSIRSIRLRRTVADTVLTLATILIAIQWMNGVGFLLYEDQSPMATILPILLVGLGVDYVIHMTTRYREEAASGESVDGSVAAAIKTVGIALALATVTTSVGFLTNIFNDIPALREFGVLAAVGISFSFLLALTFVPAIRELLDRRGDRVGSLDRDAMRSSEGRALPRLIGRTSWLARRAAVWVVVGSVVLGGVGAWLTFTQLETKFSVLDFVPTTSPLRGTAETILTEFEFPESTLDLIDGGDVATAAAWNAMVDANENLAVTENVVVSNGSPLARSPVSIVGQLVDPESPLADASLQQAAAAVGLGPDLRMPEGADVVALYGAAFEAAPSEMASVVSRDDSGAYVATLFTIQTQAGEPGAAQLKADLGDAFQPVTDEGLAAVATSQTLINEVVLTTLQESQRSSLMITLAAVLVLLTINFLVEARRPALGVLTTIPVVLVVLLSFGIMALLGIPFGPVTATIAALAIGIGIPYMIHITHRYQEDRVRCDTGDIAVHSTLTHTGGALAGSALTTAFGFGVLVISSTIPFQQFAFVTAYTILLALAGAVLILPSYLVLWDRWHRRRGEDPIDREALEAALQEELST